MIFLEEQLHFLQAIQTIRGPWVDSFFRFLNFFDSDLYAALAIGLTFCFLPAWGRRLAFLIPLDALINYWAKIGMALPRPCAFEPSLALIPARTLYGFPSGGAEMTFVFAACLITFWKNRWAIPLGLTYLLIVSFSRMFLGVHFPIDVLGGWLLALFLFFIFTKVYEPIERFSCNRPHTALLLSLLVAVLCVTLCPRPRVFFLMKVTSLVSIAAYVQYHIGTWRKRRATA